MQDISSDSWLTGGGEMGKLIREKDWSQTPLGSMKDWPQSLKHTVNLVVETQIPSVIYWGEHLTAIYNDAYRPLLGNKHIALGRPLTDIWSEVEDFVRPLAQKTLAGETSYFRNRDFVLMRRGKPEKSWFDFCYSPLRDDTGTIAGILNISIERTEQLKAERDLRESKKYLHLAVEVAHLGIWHHDIEKDLVHMDERMRAIWGVEKATIPQPEVIQRIHPEDRSQVFEDFEAALNARTSDDYSFQYRIIWDDGSVRWISANGQAVMLEGQVTEFVGTALDITKLKRTEQELVTLNETLEQRVEERTLQVREQEERLRIAMEAADLGSWDLDLTTDTSSVRSLRHDQIFGYKEPQKEWGQSIALEHVVPEDQELFKQAFNEALETASLFFQVRVQWPDDSIHWIEVNGKTYYNEKKQPVRMAGVVADITGRKQAEEAGLSYQKQLQSLASKLTKVEDNIRQQLASELHNNLGQMLAISKLKVDTLKREGLPEQTVTELSDLTIMLGEAIRYTRELMSDLKPPPALEKGNIHELMTWLAQKMRKLGLEVIIEDDGRTKPVREEIGRTLRRSVNELLFNVIKHSNVDEARLILSRESGNIQIIVEDDGKGFKMEGDEPRPTEEGGFGLFNIRERMDWLGGSFTLYTEPGKGVRAILKAPLDDEQKTENYVQGKEPLAPPVGVTGKQNGFDRKVKILLVDDHEMMRKGLRKMIEEQKDLSIIAEASTGEKAIALAKQFSPDAIVMDINLPEIGGIEATKKIISEIPEVSVVGLSLHEGEEVARQMKNAGAVAYLSKTEAFESLCDTIRKVVYN